MSSSAPCRLRALGSFTAAAFFLAFVFFPTGIEAFAPQNPLPPPPPGTAPGAERDVG